MRKQRDTRDVWTEENGHPHILTVSLTQGRYSIAEVVTLDEDA
jgi:hypothetical protein